jgi:signal transduction histidine kinase/CheY-like chemotaxis protein
LPTPMTILLIAIAAILWSNGLNYVLFFTARRRSHLNGLFGVLSLLGGAYALSCLMGYRATSLSSCLYASKWTTTFTRLILAILPWFIGLYSDFKPKRFLGFLSVAFLLLGAANLISEQGLLFSHVTGVVQHVTPWGESLSALAGTVSAVTYGTYLLYLAVIGFAAICGWRLLRRGAKKRGWRLLILVGFAVAGFVNDTLLDEGKIRSINLEEFVIFAFLLVIGTWLGARRIMAESNCRMLVQQTQRIESLGLLTGGVAHDFNNLLTALMGNVELAMKDLPVHSPARQALDEVQTISSRAAELCRKLMAYSGRAGSVSRPIVMREIVEEIARILEVSLYPRIRLVLGMPSSLPHVMGDVTQLRQVIMNLIINASEAIGHQEGTITVAMTSRKVTRAEIADFVAQSDVGEGTYVELTVTDTGCGMDEAARQRVFEPFFSTKFDGRGLGMAAVLGILREHKGAICIGSEVGKGATVRVLLPVADESASSQPVLSPEGARQEVRATVLIVDDNPRVLGAVSQLVGALGYSVLTAGGGHEALRVYGENHTRIHCVLLDLTMPDMDGIETMNGLRAIDSRAKIVLSSGYSESSVRRRLAGEGPTRFLQKPFVEEDLKLALESAIGSEGSGNP